MLFRFSLYGFLKNQRYFEPFLVLAFLEKGLSFFEIGLLVAFREIIVNLWEIPSGAVADVCGRRGSMIVSFVAYTVSFFVFGLAESLTLLFVGMFFFAIGEAFRTGTHKAMIFQWLRLQNRLDERTRVYGYTRSWSKLGSAASVVLAAVFVVTSESYVTIFYFAALPAVLNIVNFLGYPKELEGERPVSRSPRDVTRHLRESLGAALTRPGLRRLVFESMGYEGIFHAVKDYLQPVIQGLVLAGWGAAVTSEMSEIRTTALLIGPVYLVLHLLSATAARQAHRVAVAAGGEDGAARWLWGVTLVLFAVLAAGGWLDIHPVLIVALVILHVLQNFWRPILISRFDAHGSESQGATVLSIESQSRRLVTMAAAPVLGLAVDFVQRQGIGGPFWPVGVLGTVVALVFVVTGRRAVAC